jgi:adenosylcobyric acid synthase
VEAEVAGSGLFLCEAPDSRINGYEIHMGRTELAPDVRPAFTILVRSGEKVFFPDGAVNRDGLVFGTYIHGIFDSDSFRRHLINTLRRRKGLDPLSSSNTLPVHEQRERDFDKLAAVVRSSLDMEKIYSLLGLEGPI